MHRVVLKVKPGARAVTGTITVSLASLGLEILRPAELILRDY